MEKVLTLGQMVESTMVTGNEIRCMVKAYSRGLMAVNMKVSTTMIKSKAMASSTGQMVDNTMDTGCLESKKASVSTSMLKEKCVTEDGRMESVSNGYQRMS